MNCRHFPYNTLCLIVEKMSFLLRGLINALVCGHVAGTMGGRILVVLRGAMKGEGPREEEEAPAAEGAVLTARNGIDTGCEKAGLWESYRLSLRFANSHQYINYTV